MAIGRQEAVFELVRGLSKAEKRNFKLFAARSEAHRESKFIALFDALDTLDEYDEAKVLKKTGIRKEQLPNMKSYLYRQILVSVRLLNVQHIGVMEVRQMIDFARILYDKNMFRQALQMLDRAKRLALELQNFTLALEIVEFEKRVESLHMNRSATGRAASLSEQAETLAKRIANINGLSNLSVQLYSLNLQLGYVRSEKDRKLVTDFFKTRLDAYDDRGMSFHERLYLYQARMGYSYIRYDFAVCYRYALRLVGLFDERPDLISVYYDHYVRAVSRLLDVLFMTRRHDQMVWGIEKLERELPKIRPMTDHLIIISNLCLLQAKINVHFLEGSFAEGVQLAAQVDDFLNEYGRNVDEHYRMLLSYKIACLYFGNGEYKKCINYLHTIISIPNPQFRRDLQVFARILHLIASYEAGDDYSLEYQIKSVYAFVVKTNDMHAVQHEIITFLKRIPHTYASDFKGELTRLYEHLKPFESHPYERRPFFYLDIISWLESKIQDIPIAEIIRQKYGRRM
ncbi:MAG: hypothetical protein J1E79_00040 [Rikenella sp.]|nr:hypothetical protein [Rikenella sp.]